MRIEAADLRLAATQARSQARTVSESLRISRPPTAGPGGERLTLSAAARAAAASARAPSAPAATAARASAAAEATEATDAAPGGDQALALLKAILERLFGVEVELFDPARLREPAAGTPAAPAGRGADAAVEFRRTVTETELQSVAFSARATLRTADGREIEVSLDLELQYAASRSETVELLVGAARRAKDPLVINLDVPSARLAAGTFRFDLDADGTTEELPRLAAGSAFIALDRNANGRIDDGGELFGARSGDGFAELAAFDADGNGFVDEADPVFARLVLYRPGEDTRSLAAAGVGALGLARAATPLTLATPAGAAGGELRATGFYLRESGAAGTLQQFDYFA